MQTCGAVELTITRQDDFSIRRNQRMKLAQQGTMQGLGQMACLALTHQPAHGQSALVGNHADHQCHTAASNHAAVNGEQQGLMRQRAEEVVCDGQKPLLTGLGVVGKPAFTVDEDGLNTIIWEQNKDRPLGDVLAAFEETHQDFLATLEPLSNADLLKTYSQYLPDEPWSPFG